MKQYVLTLSEEQANTVREACELYARLGLGQFERITELFMDYHGEDAFQRRDIANDILYVAAKCIFGTNRYNRPDIKQIDACDRAFDIHQVIRYAKSWHYHPEGGCTVDFYDPIPKSGEPLAKCEIREEKE